MLFDGWTSIDMGTNKLLLVTRRYTSDAMQAPKFRGSE